MTNDEKRLEVAIAYERLRGAMTELIHAKGYLSEIERAETATDDCRFINLVISWIETKQKVMLVLNDMTEDDVYDLLQDEAD